MNRTETIGRHDEIRGSAKCDPVNRMKSGQVIENPVSGEHIVLCQTGEETEGKLMSFELSLPPGGHVPSSHAHPQQEERFTVIEGRMKFRVGFRSRFAGAGETVVVPPGRAHWFGNAGDGPARLMVEVRPALDMAEMFDMAAAIARGRRSPIPNPLDLALFLDEFRSEVGVPFVPKAITLPVAHALARLAALLGLDSRYRNLSRSSDHRQRSTTAGWAASE